ncbi:MAG: hypothetical protein M9894_30510 [Planctomycetes bacterium]|nr:hypothetical protein [Planctomycetota bacterium]
MERVRAGATRRLHLEWLAFLGDPAAAAALALLDGERRSARQRADARESALDAGSRAASGESELFWYTLLDEDGQAALRALLAAVELTDPRGADELARLVLAPGIESDSRRQASPGGSPVVGFARAFIRHHLVNRVEDGDEAFHDAMASASRVSGRAAVLDAARRALRAWWIDGEDIARRLGTTRPEQVWRLMRQDDNGNTFAVSCHPSAAEAEETRQSYEARGHKQRCWVEPVVRRCEAERP